MAERLLVTKYQAVSILQQIKEGKEINVFLPVPLSNPLFKYSIEDLEKRLLQYLDEEQFAGIVEEEKL